MYGVLRRHSTNGAPIPIFLHNNVLIGSKNVPKMKEITCTIFGVVYRSLGAINKAI